MYIQISTEVVMDFFPRSNVKREKRLSISHVYRRNNFFLPMKLKLHDAIKISIPTRRRRRRRCHRYHHCHRHRHCHRPLCRHLRFWLTS